MINDLLDQIGPQSYKDSRYTLKMHKNGYFYMLRNQTLTKNKNDEMKRDKQEIQRLTRALKGRSLRIKVQFKSFLVLYGYSRENVSRPYQSYET